MFLFSFRIYFLIALVNFLKEKKKKIEQHKKKKQRNETKQKQ